MHNISVEWVDPQLFAAAARSGSGTETKYNESGNIDKHTADEKTEKSLQRDRLRDIFGNSMYDQYWADYGREMNSMDSSWKKWLAITVTFVPVAVGSIIPAARDDVARIGQGIEIVRHSIAELMNMSQNELIGRYNNVIKDLNKAKKEFESSWKKLREKENILNKTKGLRIKHDPQYKTIMAIGITGYGKSVVCNRLIGIKGSLYDIEDKTEEENDTYNKFR